MFSSRATTVIAALLLLPPVAHSAMHREPYPAVLLPAGAGMIDVGGGVATFSAVGLYAVVTGQVPVRLDPPDFMGSIPVQYAPPLARRRFGYGREQDDGRVLSLDERAEVRRWLTSRVVRSVPGAAALQVRFEKHRVAIRGTEHEVVTLAEYALPLH